MGNELNISPSLSLDVDTFTTSTQAIVAKKGSGKTYKASVEAEELLGAGQQVLVIDPTSAWWGLRSSADGRAAGYPITIFGGDHGDLVLEASAGEALADAVIAERFSAIFDLSLFSKGEEQRFCAAFLERLYRRNREAVHLFLDEADVYAPQRPFGVDEAKTLGACQSIVRRGRIRGIGCTLITQRPQVVNKDVLSQVDMLTVLKMNHPKDLGAIDEWVGVHGDVALAKQMRATLPSLARGDAWVWAPALDIFQRITFRDRRTFDSGATPKAGEAKREPKILAPVDIARLGATIAATVERAKQEDPKALRTRIAELERQLKASVEIETVERVVEKVVEVPVLRGGEMERLRSLITDAQLVLGHAQKIADAVDGLGVCIKDIEGAISLAGQLPPRAAIVETPPRHAASNHAKTWGQPTSPIADIKAAVEVVRRQGTDPKPAAGLTPAQQRIVNTIATLVRLGIEPTRTTLAAWLGMHPNSKSYVNNLGSLRSAGLVEGFGLTAAGAKIVRAEMPRSRAEVHALLLGPLTPAQRRIVEVVLQHGAIGREELGRALGQHPNTKALVNNIGALRGRALLTQGWPLRPERVFRADVAAAAGGSHG